MRSKLGWLVAAAVGASTAVATTISVWHQVSSYSEVRRAALVATAEVFAAAAGPATAAHDELQAFQSLRAIAGMPDIQHAEIRTLDGKRLATAGAAVHLIDDVSIVAGQESSISILDLLASGTVQVKVPVVHAGAPVGELLLRSGISDLWWKIFYTVVFTVLGGLVALLVGFLVAMRLQRNVTGPIQNLLHAMTTVRQTHRYDLQVADAKDREIGELVAGFNEMLRDVRERDDRLEAHRQNLEQEVADRTHDLKQARDAAESANRAKSEFLATMSHEIRTPMNGMMVMADMLVGGELPSRQRRYAEIIARSGRSLLSIIGDILDFSKIEAGKLELEDVEVDLNQIAESVAGLFAEQARAKGVELAVWVDPALPRTVRGDSVRLTQVVTNLVNNALKFTAAGSVRIDLGFFDAGKTQLDIAVSDSGIGIPEDKLATIFESFSQADQSTTRHFGGTGLGLTICKRLAAAMGGDIQVTSTLGKGSRFSIVIPCRAAAASHWPTLAPHSGESRTCVIDVALPAAADVLTRYLSATGFDVVAATALSKSPPRLICVDASRIGVHADRASETVLLALASSHGDEAKGADRLIALPVMRSEIETLLSQIVRGEKIAPATEAADARGRAPRFSRFRALVADDNAVNREVAHEALSGLGGVVTLVEDGVQAVEMMQSGRFDLVFMDGSMPEMDGMTAARHIRSHETSTNAARTPIVGLTADVVGVGVEQWREAGVDTVVYKPFNIADLARTIEKLLPHLAAARDAVQPDDRPPSVAADHEAAGEPAVIDDAVFGQLLEAQRGGHDNFAQRVVKLYAENAPLAVTQIEEAALRGDRAGCARAAHSLKSMSFSIGAARVARRAHELELRSREDNGAIDADAVATVKQALADAMQEIERRIGVIDTRDKAVGAPAPVATREPEADMAQAMQRGLEQDQFSLLYQPIVDPAGTMVGVEALMRWSPHPGQQVPPTTFIPIAETSGLIHDLGHWAMQRAFADCQAWEGLDISVNVSPVQLMRNDFVSRVERAVATSRLDPKRVVLEITESTLLSAEAAVERLMEALCAQGMRFALDDFGTGYASLASLRRFPFSRIKIDRSFVSNLQTTADATIVHAVIAIAKSLGLKVVAEGVEEEAQRRFLKSSGVNLLQGYLFGKPMSKDDITARLSSERSSLARTAS